MNIQCPVKTLGFESWLSFVPNILCVYASNFVHFWIYGSTEMKAISWFRHCLKGSCTKDVRKKSADFDPPPPLVRTCPHPDNPPPPPCGRPQTPHPCIINVVVNSIRPSGVTTGGSGGSCLRAPARRGASRPVLKKNKKIVYIYNFEFIWKYCKKM